MRLSGFSFAKGTRLLSLSLAGLLVGGAHAQRHVAVGLSGSEDVRETAAKIAAGSARVVGVEEAWRIVYLDPAEAMTAKELAARLSSMPGVALARVCDLDATPHSTDFQSVQSVDRLLREWKARNEDRKTMAKALGKPEPEKTELMKTGYWDAWRFWIGDRAYPKDRVDVKAYLQALQHRDRMPAFNASDAPGGAAWEYVGPKNFGVPYRTYHGLPPVSGRVGAIAVDPSSPNIVYLGGANGGVWKSTDAGANWTPLTDHWPTIHVSSLAIDPSNTQTIYAGTGDFHGWAFFSFGIMKSTDGGATWTNQGNSQFGNCAVSSILVDPDQPQTVIVTTGRSRGVDGWVWRSTDGGQNWAQAIPTRVNWCGSAIGAQDAGGIRALYVAGGGPSANIWRSLDHGATWTRLTVPATPVNHQTVAVAASPAIPGNVYLLVNNDRKIFRSTNFGATWTDITGGFPHGPDNFFWQQSTYNWLLACSTKPGPTDVIYAGMIDLAQSPDGGFSWRSIGGPTYQPSAVAHNDQQAACVDPTNPNVVYFGSDGGAYRYTFNPATNNGSFAYLSGTLGLTMFYKIDGHPSNPARLIGGTQDNATALARNDLENWLGICAGDGGYCAIDQANPDVGYASTQFFYSIFGTTTNWQGISVIGPAIPGDRIAFIPPLVLDPNDGRWLYIGTNYIWRRDNQAQTWTPRLAGQQLCTSGELRAIAIAPGDSDRIYTGASNGEMWMSVNRGQSWTQINTGSPGLPNRVITSISVNPANKNDVLITVSGTGTGHVWRCADTTAATRVWQDRSGGGGTSLPNVSANRLARDPFDFESILYAGTDVGVFVSEDGGSSWANATAPLGLPNGQVTDFKIQVPINSLIAGTYGRGMWKLALPPIVYPSAFTVISGTHMGGGLSDLRESDNRVLGIFADDFEPYAEVELVGTSPIAAPSELHFFLEASSQRIDTQQSIDLFNYSASRWDRIDARAPTLGDSRIVRKVIGNAAPYVHPTTREVRARIRFELIDETVWPLDGWLQWIDRAVWRVVP